MVGRRLNSFAVVRVLLGIALLASLSAQPAAAWRLADSNTCMSLDEGSCESQRSPQVNFCAFGKGAYLMGDASSGANVKWGPNDHCADPANHDRVSAGYCGGFDGDRQIIFDYDNSDGRLMVYFLFVGREDPSSDFGVGTQSAGTCS